MKYITPSSKIVFTDLIILLVSVLMGMNSIMSFSQENYLPPLNLPKPGQSKEPGKTHIQPVYISIQNRFGKIQYFYNEKPCLMKEIFNKIDQAHVRIVIIRADKNYLLRWNDMTKFISRLIQVGVKEIGYAIQS